MPPAILSFNKVYGDREASIALLRIASYCHVFAYLSVINNGLTRRRSCQGREWLGRPGTVCLRDPVRDGGGWWGYQTCTGSAGSGRSAGRLARPRPQRPPHTPPHIVILQPPLTRNRRTPAVATAARPLLLQPAAAAASDPPLPLEPPSPPQPPFPSVTHLLPHTPPPDSRNASSPRATTLHPTPSPSIASTSPETGQQTTPHFRRAGRPARHASRDCRYVTALRHTPSGGP